MTNLTVDNYQEKNAYIISPNTIRNAGSVSTFLNDDIISNFEKSTENFVATSLVNILASDLIIDEFNVQVLFCGELCDIPAHSDYKDLLDKAKDNIIVICKTVERIDTVYSDNSEKIVKKTYVTNYLDYSYLLRLLEANDLVWTISDGDDEDSIKFKLSWSYLDQIEDIYVPKPKSLHEISPF